MNFHGLNIKMNMKMLLRAGVQLAIQLKEEQRSERLDEAKRREHHLEDVTSGRQQICEPLCWNPKGEITLIIVL